MAGGLARTTAFWPVRPSAGAARMSLEGRESSSDPGIKRQTFTTSRQLLLPVVDLVRVHSEMHRQLGDAALAPYCRHRHLRLERRVVLLPCPLHVLLPRYPRFLGAGIHLSHLSHFRGPAQNAAITQIFFANDARPGERFQQTVTVRVADIEGSDVTASLTVLIYVSPIQLPPYCRNKP